MTFLFDRDTIENHIPYWIPYGLYIVCILPYMDMQVSLRVWVGESTFGAAHATTSGARDLQVNRTIKNSLIGRKWPAQIDTGLLEAIPSARMVRTLLVAIVQILFDCRSSWLYNLDFCNLGEFTHPPSPHIGVTLHSDQQAVPIHFYFKTFLRIAVF